MDMTIMTIMTLVGWSMIGLFLLYTAPIWGFIFWSALTGAARAVKICFLIVFELWRDLLTHEPKRRW
jgi:hypothetical protein